MVLLAAISITSVSCQKEEAFNSQITTQEAAYSHSVLYFIDGEQHTVTFYSEEAWHAFLTHLFALAQEGHQVTFRALTANSSTSARKEKVVYTTENQADALKWADKMEDEGYAVTITFDSNTGIYTCIAIR